MSQSQENLSPEEFQKLQEYFEQAIELPYSEQAQLIRQAENEHPRIVGQLQAMLQHDAATEPPDPQATAALIGRTDELDRSVEGYEILEEIGRGGMGVVYKAHQLNPDRIVALKMIRVGRFASELDIRRFAVEIDAIAKLEHANIVSIYEIGSHHGEHFFTMQFVEGSGFDEYLASGECARQEALKILTQVCDAVAYCHDRGIVHRDLKPSNILLDENRVPKLTDFGLAKHLEKDSNLTRTGDLMGTPGFMAPEQVDHSPENTIDARADVYALGAILYKILTGKPPIDVAEVNLVCAVDRVHSNDIIAPRLIDRWISRDLETICLKCLDGRPENRYANAGEVADELRRVADGEPIAARPISVVHRLFRWSRRQPGLAVTLLAISILYLYHLICVYGLKVPGTGGSFHVVSSIVAAAWVVGAYCFQKLLVWTHGSRWPLFGWVSMEVALLSSLLVVGDAGRSTLVSIYLVLVAASVLRFQPILVAYVTCLCIVAYLFQVWLTNVVKPLDPLTFDKWVPMGLSILCIGLIQYFALRRSRNAIELMSNRSQ